MEISNIILIFLVHGVAFAALCSLIGTQRQIGTLGGALLGFLLGTIGLILVLCSPRKNPTHFTDQLQNYKSLLDSGTITRAEYNHLKGRLLEKQ
jgi:hypothetical protein